MNTDCAAESRQPLPSSPVSFYVRTTHPYRRGFRCPRRRFRSHNPLAPTVPAWPTAISFSATACLTWPPTKAASGATKEAASTCWAQRLSGGRNYQEFPLHHRLGLRVQAQWDSTWDSTNRCYKGPGSAVCYHQTNSATAEATGCRCLRCRRKWKEPIDRWQDYSALTSRSGESSRSASSVTPGVGQT